jgi:hypothetical protein
MHLHAGYRLRRRVVAGRRPLTVALRTPVRPEVVAMLWTTPESAGIRLHSTPRPSPIPSLMARLADLGGTVLPRSPAGFWKLIAEETEKWGKVIRAANIKPE